MKPARHIATLRISLAEIEPEIWRRVEVPLAFSLQRLHSVIQAAFGWLDYHLFEFKIAGERYGEPDEDEHYEHGRRAAARIRLAQIVARGIDRFGYEYDFGDGWEHVIVVEQVAPALADAVYPRLVAGARRGPPEDVGGPHGYQEFLTAVTRPRHRDKAGLLRWYGGPYDPDDIDPERIALRLEPLARRYAADLRRGRKRPHPPIS